MTVYITERGRVGADRALIKENRHKCRLYKADGSGPKRCYKLPQTNSMIQKRKALLTRMGFLIFPAENEYKCSASWRPAYRGKRIGRGEET